MGPLKLQWFKLLPSNQELNYRASALLAIAVSPFTCQELIGPNKEIFTDGRRGGDA